MRCSRAAAGLAVLVALACAPAISAAAPPPKGRLTLRTDAAFTKLWAVWTVTVGGAPDSLVVVIQTTGKADLRQRYTVRSKTDSADVGYPAPGTTVTVTALATAYQGGKASATATLGSGSVQGDVPTPTGTLKLVPAAFTVDPDAGGTCAAWQASHPGQSPWVLVNATAVPACQGPVGPKIVQFCCIFTPTGGIPEACAPAPATADAQAYCAQQLQSFIQARSL